jgi:hypothetical protein
MTRTKKEYKALGSRLMQVLRHAFQGSTLVPGDDLGEYERLRLLPSDFSIRFLEWGPKPFYIILYWKRKYLFELDLTRIVESGRRFTWYLSRPTRDANRLFLKKLLPPGLKETPSEYAEAVRDTKARLASGQVVGKTGYGLCENAARKDMESKFVDVIQKAIAAHRNLHLQRKGAPSEYDFDDPKAIEGYEQDRLITSYGRNRSLVEQCKKRDDFTCQACGFRLEIHGQYIIECHHINPVSQGGLRLSSVDELVCLCPTCHRIAHKRSNPFSVKEIREFERKTGRNKLPLRRSGS